MGIKHLGYSGYKFDKTTQHGPNFYIYNLRTGDRSGSTAEEFMLVFYDDAQHYCCCLFFFCLSNYLSQELYRIQTTWVVQHQLLVPIVALYSVYKRVSTCNLLRQCT